MNYISIALALNKCIITAPHFLKRIRKLSTTSKKCYFYCHFKKYIQQIKSFGWIYQKLVLKQRYVGFQNKLEYFKA